MDEFLDNIGVFIYDLVVFYLSTAYSLIVERKSKKLQQNIIIIKVKYHKVHHSKHGPSIIIKPWMFTIKQTTNSVKTKWRNPTNLFRMSNPVLHWCYFRPHAWLLGWITEFLKLSNLFLRFINHVLKRSYSFWLFL